LSDLPAKSNSTHAALSRCTGSKTRTGCRASVSRVSSPMTVCTVEALSLRLSPNTAPTNACEGSWQRGEQCEIANRPTAATPYNYRTSRKWLIALLDCYGCLNSGTYSCTVSMSSCERGYSNTSHNFAVYFESTCTTAWLGWLAALHFAQPCRREFSAQHGALVQFGDIVEGLSSRQHRSSHCDCAQKANFANQNIFT
jgi:hypothetical protein